MDPKKGPAGAVSRFGYLKLGTFGSIPRTGGPFGRGFGGPVGAVGHGEAPLRPSKPRNPPAAVTIATYGFGRHGGTGGRNSRDSRPRHMPLDFAVIGAYAQGMGMSEQGGVPTASSVALYGWETDTVHKVAPGVWYVRSRSQRGYFTKVVWDFDDSRKTGEKQWFICTGPHCRTKGEQRGNWCRHIREVDTAEKAQVPARPCAPPNLAALVD